MPYEQPDAGAVLTDERVRRPTSPSPPTASTTQTDALMDLAEVLSTIGRRSEAAELVEDAVRRYDTKEVRPAAERARRRLVELRGGDPDSRDPTRVLERL